MTIVDGDGNGSPDGIINLYDEYNALTGGAISLATGTWFDPGYNFALDETTGDLHLWDLTDASLSLNDYQFQLIDANSSCPDGIIATVNLILGPFSGFARPVLNIDDVNLEICDTGSTPTDVCVVLPDVNLFETLEAIPSPHLNGQWIYNGSSSNFISLVGSELRVTIPYNPGPPLVDQETFELTYRVSGMPPCNASVETTVNVSVTRQVFSGYAINQRVCELDILNGGYDTDLDLTNDAFLLYEDVEGIWMGDTYGQIMSPVDSQININEVYQQIVANNPRFGCEEISFNYSVEQRSGVCGDALSTIKFKIYEYLRPFSQAGTLEFCEDDPTAPGNINLYDQLEFTTENGVLYDYMSNEFTNWTFVSGPSNLGLISQGAPGYTYSGRVDLNNAAPGTYVFEYEVDPLINCPNEVNFPFEVLDYNHDVCNPLQVNTGFCDAERTQVVLTVHPKNYAGEDTSDLTFCEDDPIIASPLDLFTLLDTNGVDDPIYQGAMGTWTDNATGSVIGDPTAFTLPTINDQHIFDFTYTTTTVNGCEDTANLRFTVYEAYQAGVGATIDVCNTNATIDLFDSLTGNPNTTGTWTGPNGYTTTDHHATFDPATSEAGTYTYTVPDNVLCTGNETTVTVVLHQSPDAGSDMQGAVCRSDLQIDLTNYLDATADSGGFFVDLDATNVLSGNLLDVSQLIAGTYRFEYQIQGHASCNLATAIIAITVEEVAVPITSNQTFCTSDGATVADLEASGAQDYNWYATLDALETLSFGEVLVDGEDYYVAAVDSNGCESQRVSMLVTLLPLDHVDCDDCIKDGISVNGDNQNDVFDLCNLPVAFPNFEINIYNRYGSIVYKGNKGTEYFDGVSNVSLTLGKALPSGVYFYVFDPKDGKTAPFQGNFYLSR
ncbi:hypothetical protein GCM10022395_36530 [Snuella lapsa]|uniref:Ig-like domain-containing protein n=2 Tax=Snuella lapsa TaxID=870481 RepID=A0ABP6YLF2_9FLAO